MRSREKQTVDATKMRKEEILTRPEGGRQFARISQSENYAYYMRQLVTAEPKPHDVVMPTFLQVISAVETNHRARRHKGHLDPCRIAILANGKVDLHVHDSACDKATRELATFKYAAPELVLQTHETGMSVTADCYALGFMFYEILLGRDLFQQQFAEVGRRGEIGWLSWHADFGKRAKPLHTILGVFPLALSKLIDEMMEKDVAKRRTELGEIAERLAVSCRATATFSALSVSSSDMRAQAKPRQLALGPLLKLWSRWAVPLRNKARTSLSRRSAAA